MCCSVPGPELKIGNFSLLINVFEVMRPDPSSFLCSASAAQSAPAVSAVRKIIFPSNCTLVSRSPVWYGHQLARPGAVLGIGYAFLVWLQLNVHQVHMSAHFYLSVAGAGRGNKWYTALLTIHMTTLRFTKTDTGSGRVSEI